MHAHFAGVGYTASRIKEKAGIAFVMTEHLSSMMKPAIDKWLFDTASKAYESADALIAVSPELKDVIKKRFNKDALYIPNIVDTGLFTYQVRKDNARSFNFISIGGLIYRKRMDLTIEAFAKAFGNDEDVSLTIFGEGTERTRLENLIRKYDISDRVKLMGLQSRKTLAEYLKKSDCFVLASQAETFGVVYIEALASGVPVIATKCGGPESFVNDRNGLIIPVDDVDALADAMKYMYDNSDKYNKEAISQETREQFSPESIAGKLTEVYKQLIKE